LALAGFLGPTFGVFLVLVALETAPVGIVSALSNLKPIILVPIGFFFFHEHISRRAILGTLVAVVGTIMIFFL
jgi:drug/metabolite transporter (DMT)-like permease